MSPPAEALPGGSSIGMIRPMTVFPLPGVSDAPAMINLPTRDEIREMLMRPAVAITALICATLAFVAALAGIVFLAFEGRDSAVIGVFVAGPVVVVLGVIAKRLGAVKEAVNNATVVTPPSDGKA